MGIDVTAFGVPILLTSGNTLYPISFPGGFFPPSLYLSLFCDDNRKGRQMWWHLSPFSTAQNEPFMFGEYWEKDRVVN